MNSPEQLVKLKQIVQYSASILFQILELPLGLQSFIQVDGSGPQGRGFGTLVFCSLHSHDILSEGSLMMSLCLVSLSVRRRLSVQLPILHHSYLPIIGGISTSTASLFSSQEVFLHHHDNFLYA